MRIALLDTTQYEPTSPIFREAITELGHECIFVDEADVSLKTESSLIERVAYRCLGRRPLGYWDFNSRLVSKVIEARPDVFLVVKGSFLSPKSLRAIRANTDATVVNFATDDPFNPRNSTAAMRECIPLYDLYACTKRAIMSDVKTAGCAVVEFVPFGFKPSVHFTEECAAGTVEPEVDVAFIGGADEDRVPYFKALARIPDISMRLYGSGWDRFPELRQYWGGFATGPDYRRAMRGAKIVVGLVRRANRDGHSMRTFEIPACGAFMLAERTDEHQEWFTEGIEAAYFTSTEELVEKVCFYSGQRELRRRISMAGQRVVIDSCTYRHRLQQILSLVDRIGSP